KRRIAYALIQLARLRVDEKRLENVLWYIKQAEQLYAGIINGPGDSIWDEPFHVMLKRIASQSQDSTPSLNDEADQLVRFVLEQIRSRENNHGETCAKTNR